MVSVLAPLTPVPKAKSPEAFRTISEVAAELDVPQHVLRFWESRFVQVRPTKRAGGRRYYRPEDVDLLRGIHSLLYSDGFTIKGVQKILRERGPRHVAEVGRASLAPVPAPRLRVVEPMPIVPEPDPTHARAAIAAVERAHASVVDIGPHETLAESLASVPEGRAEMAVLDGDLFAPREPARDTARDVARVLAAEERRRLEGLLAELLDLKSRLDAAKA